jgi:hypothetical protein
MDHTKRKEYRMATVGYFEGTDPLVLTKLSAHGIGTVPLSNGFDHHGKYVNHLTSQDGVSVVIGYLHKVMPTSVTTLAPQDLLFGCFTHEIPVLLIADKADHEVAARLLGEASDRVRLVDPRDLHKTVLEMIA